MVFIRVKIGGICFVSAILFLSTLTYGISCTRLIESCLGACAIKPEEIVLVDRLPEPFSNDKLPASEQATGKKCLKHLGCLNKIPPWFVPAKSPKKMNFQVKLLDNPESLVIKYEPVKHCLRHNILECQTYPFRLDKLRRLKFDPKLRTIVIIGGFRSQDTDRWQQELAKVWPELDKVNRITVGWSGGNSGCYPDAMANSKIISRQFVVFLYYLAQTHRTDLNDAEFVENFHLIGHSLGAHISGFVGKDLNGMLGRITGLDPAGPGFTSVDRRFRLDRQDAQLVAVVHTNGGSSLSAKEFGLDEPIGHLDFYANDGKHQPACEKAERDKTNIGCSHTLAHDLLIESLDNELKSINNQGEEHRMFALRKDNYEEFKGCPSLMKCSDGQSLVPLDFVSPSRELRHKLNQNYGISFDSDQINKFFFHTEKEQPYLSQRNKLISIV